MSKNDVLWLLSGDTTVMFDLLADVPELCTMAQEVASNRAEYNQLLELSYEYF
jgi:hypothetical protein